MRYGLPYQGSKNKIAEWVVSHLPRADTLYDLFAGGCAITHCALTSGKYHRIACNDITDAPTLFLKAIRGEYRDFKDFITREEFEMLKGSDPFVRLVYSFGNDRETYLYAKEVEPSPSLYPSTGCRRTGSYAWRR